jgi:hypothetical protein
VSIVSETINRCPPHCRIIVSDRTLADDALYQLKTLHAADRRILFIEQLGAPGWREHVNWLLPKVKTEFFSIMAQDDSISDCYYEKLMEAHMQAPNLAVSFAPIIAHNLPGKSEPVRFESLPFETGLRKPAEEAIELARKWNLGIAYRGVIKRKIARTIARTPKDRFADFAWVFGLALRGHLREVKEATYHKRYHPGSAHAEWGLLTSDERLELITSELKRVFFFRPFEAKKIALELRQQFRDGRV